MQLNVSSAQLSGGKQTYEQTEGRQQENSLLCNFNSNQDAFAQIVLEGKVTDSVFYQYPQPRSMESEHQFKYLPLTLGCTTDSIPTVFSIFILY